MKLNPVLSSDALKLSRLAKEIYREFYLHLWKPGGADWYMHDHAYHPDQLLREIHQPETLYFLFNAADELMGYLKLITQTAYPDNPLEIERIYLHKRFNR